MRRDLERVAASTPTASCAAIAPSRPGWCWTTQTLVPATRDLAYRGGEVWLARDSLGVLRARGRAPGSEALFSGAIAQRVAPVGDLLLVGIRGPKSLALVSNQSPTDIPLLGLIDYAQTDPTGLAADRSSTAPEEEARLRRGQRPGDRPPHHLSGHARRRPDRHARRARARQHRRRGPGAAAPERARRRRRRRGAPLRRRRARRR
ncbi:MAG: hypothetical protein U1F43_06490 [Myxococcota bacterium]